MNQEHIDLDSLFDQQESPKAAPARPRKKPILIILIFLLALALLAAGAYLYWRFTDTSDPIRVTIYKQPLAEDNFSEADHNTLADFGNRTVFDITDGYQRFYVETTTPTKPPLSDTNFWVFVKANSWAVRSDWTVETEIQNLCIHEGQAQSTPGCCQLLDEKFQFDGWLIYGYIPHSADLQLRLKDGNGQEITTQTLRVDPYISPMLDYSYGIEDQTIQLLDYAVHLQALAPLMDLPVDQLLPAYMALTEEYPALLTLLNRMDLQKTINEYVSTGDSVCLTYAQKIESLFDAYLDSWEYIIGKPDYTPLSEFVAMDTRALVEYICNYSGLRDAIIIGGLQMLNYNKLNEIYARLSYTCPALQELEQRDDAAAYILPLAPENPVAKYLLGLPEIQRSLKVEGIIPCLLALHLGADITPENIIDVVVNIDDVSYLAVSGTLEETIGNMPFYQELISNPKGSMNLFFSKLRSSEATDTQKAVATAFLNMPVYQEVMNATQKKLFEESKVQLGN